MSASDQSPKLSGATGTSTGARKRIQSCFARGKELALTKEHDYAHQMFAQCVLLEPGNLMFVEAMLLNLRAKFSNDKKKIGRLACLASGHGLKRAMARQDWSEALKLGIAQLVANPWHVPTLRGMAEICGRLHHNEGELAYLKQALEANLKDADASRHCARSLARMGQFGQAIACWHRVETIIPGDREAARMISQLSDERIWRAAELREMATSPKSQAAPALTQQEESVQEAPKNIQLSPRQLLETAIAEDPTDVANYLELAEMLIEQHRLIDAQRILEQCLIACGDDPRVQEQLELVKSMQVEFLEELTAQNAPPQPFRMPWLELLLAITLLALVVQLMPGLQTALVNFASAHIQFLLFTGNILFVAGLIFVWFWQQRATNQ